MSIPRRCALTVITWLHLAAGRLYLTVGRLRRAGDAGMSTAEYAVGTVAAVAFAVVLYKIVRSPAVSAALSSIIRSALHAI